MGWDMGLPGFEFLNYYKLAISEIDGCSALRPKAISIPD